VLTAGISPDILERIELVDVSQEIDRLLESRGDDYSSLFWVNDGHFNTKGNEFFGIVVARYLEQL
jgi:hypothetical protein